MEAKSGQFRYERWRPAGTQFAEARVTVQPGGDQRVEISPDALAWMREAYGTGAATRLTPQEQVEAEQGAREGLAAAGISGRVTIDHLGISALETSPGDIVVAVSQAVLNALGQGPETNRQPSPS